MNILIAPDSFKESLTAKEAAECIERGFLSVDPGLNTVLVPLADGGEGTVRSLVDATAGQILSARVHDPVHRIIEASYGILGDGRTAVIEMAAASGLELLNESEKNPLDTSTFGTGELILHALDQKCNRIIIGIGGSATNEGGAGMIQALGGELSDSQGNSIIPTGRGLKDLATMNLDHIDPRIHDVEFIVASDVDNELLGVSGATVVFGPQKGATAAMIPELEMNLARFGEMLEHVSGKRIIHHAGAGAAGGLGAGMMAVLGAKLQPGFDLIADITGLETHVDNADIVVTGEGKMDRQTMHGKTPYGLAQLAKKNNTPVVILAGQVEDGLNEAFTGLFLKIRSITPPGMDLSSALKNGPALLEEAARQLWMELKDTLK